MLERDEVDLSVIPAVPVWSRWDAVDFSYAYWHTDTRIISGLPDAYSRDPFSYMYIFDMEVWALTAVTYVVLSVLIWLCDFPSWKDKYRPLKDYFWGLFAIAIFQNATWEPVRNLPRLPFGLWCLLVLILMNTFSSEMIAHLAAPEELERIDDFQDVLRRPEMMPVVPDRTAVSGFFQFSDDPVRSSMWKQIKKTGGRFTVHEALAAKTFHMVHGGKAVLLTEDLIARFAIKNFAASSGISLTEFYFGMHTFNALSFGFMLNRKFNKTLKDQIDSKILNYHETGHIHYRISQEFPDRTEQKSNMDLNYWEVEETPLTLKHCIPAAVVWAIGIAVSIAAFLSEICSKKATDRLTISRLIIVPEIPENFLSPETNIDIPLERISSGVRTVDVVSSANISTRPVIDTGENCMPNFVPEDCDVIVQAETE